MASLLIFGLGYTARHLAQQLVCAGWEVMSTGSSGTMAFDDRASVMLALDRATHVLSSVPPVADGDPVLETYGDHIRSSGAWLGYLSSTGVYGDAGGGWVDETAPVRGRRASRNHADADWQALGARIFRLPGIYGPGRSMIDRVKARQAHRIDLPDQVFSRVHVDDIASGVIAGFDARAGVYNLADDHPCDQNQVVEYACRLIGLPSPPMVSLESAQISAAARAFYAENRRVANGKAKRLLNWAPRFPDFRAGLSHLALHVGGR